MNYIQRCNRLFKYSFDKHLNRLDTYRLSHKRKVPEDSDENIRPPLPPLWPLLLDTRHPSAAPEKIQQSERDELAAVVVTRSY